MEEYEQVMGSKNVKSAVLLDQHRPESVTRLNKTDFF